MFFPKNHRGDHSRQNDIYIKISFVSKFPELLIMMKLFFYQKPKICECRLSPPGPRLLEPPEL